MIVAEDMAGNLLTAEENMEDICETEQGIVSKEMIMDWTSPKVQVICETTDGHRMGLNQWRYEKEREEENDKGVVFRAGEKL